MSTTTDPSAHDCHDARQDAGRAHYHRDVRKAPWPKEREFGRCYSTLPVTQTEQPC